MRDGLREIGRQVETKMKENLSGGEGDTPALSGSWPVPVRSNTLRSSTGVRTGRRMAEIWNDAHNPDTGAFYARAIQEGFYPYGNTSLPRIPGRRYLDRAVASVDSLQVLVSEMEKHLP